MAETTENMVPEEEDQEVVTTADEDTASDAEETEISDDESEGKSKDFKKEPIDDVSDDKSEIKDEVKSEPETPSDDGGGLVDSIKGGINKVQSMYATHKTIQTAKENVYAVYNSQAGVERTMWQVLEQVEEAKDNYKETVKRLGGNTCEQVATSIARWCGSQATSIVSAGTYAVKNLVAGGLKGVKEESYIDPAEELDLSGRDAVLVNDLNKDDIMKSPVETTISVFRKMLMNETEELGDRIKDNGDKEKDNLLYGDGYL